MRGAGGWGAQGEVRAGGGCEAAYSLRCLLCIHPLQVVVALTLGPLLLHGQRLRHTQCLLLPGARVFLRLFLARLREGEGVGVGEGEA